MFQPIHSLALLRYTICKNEKGGGGEKIEREKESMDCIREGRWRMDWLKSYGNNKSGAKNELNSSNNS